MTGMNLKALLSVNLLATQSNGLQSSSVTSLFRQSVREGQYTKPTNGQCPGFIQCNLVVLQEKDAFDFLLFCQRNKQACPLIEVLDKGSYTPLLSAQGADLRTDIPKYRIFKNGLLVNEVTNVINEWPEDGIAFLIGCSFTTESALLKANIPLRSVEQKTNVPMFRTNIPCVPAGKLKGNMVVSMRPVKGSQIAQEVLITNQYPHAHGPPVCIGVPVSIGIQDVMKPDFGQPVDIMDDEVPVFHACGVTPQVSPSSFLSKCIYFYTSGAFSHKVLEKTNKHRQ
jgi:uncharacterized protein YcsI (UPF0317 family)